LKLLKYLLILLVSSATLFSAIQLKSVENLRVSKITDNSVSMTWEKIDGATKYEIYRILNNDSKKIGEISGLSFIDNSVKPQNEYSYYIVAKNSEVKANKSYLYPLSIPDEGIMEIPEDFITFQKEELDNLVIDFDEKTLTLKSNEKTKNIQIGDTLLSNATNKIPSGLFYKVMSKQLINGNVVLIFEMANLEEAFSNLDETLSNLDDVNYSYEIILGENGYDIVTDGDTDIIYIK
jgi:Fibronectin type III domain.